MCNKGFLLKKKKINTQTLKKQLKVGKVIENFHHKFAMEAITELFSAYDKKLAENIIYWNPIKAFTPLVSVDEPFCEFNQYYSCDFRHSFYCAMSWHFQIF